MITDRRALEGLPLKLMIVALLLSLTFPLFMNMLEDFDENLIEQRVKNEIERLRSAAFSCYFAGPGNVRTVEASSLSLYEGFFMEIGGHLNSTQCRSIRYLASDGATMTSYLDEVPVRLSTQDSDSLRIQGGPYTVRMECVSDGNGIWVMVSFL
jgi:hypothetical protein